ncbi:hypothetical protein TWF694_000002 [Orbilia ellipsospora]|uniref:Uncharacterized protein n=1 Tax=Orbilia ellipsospora TaxID=2528407 RepID=A0AAV9XM94_9PEZI
MSQTGSTIKIASSPALAFINVTHPSALKQHSTEIRKHVMRDIGHARRRTKVKDVRRMRKTTATITNAEKSLTNAMRIRSVSDDRTERQVLCHMAQLARRYGPLDEKNLHAFLYPMEMGEPQLQTIRNLFSQTSRPRRRPLLSIWFALMATDVGAFHLLLASSYLASGCSIPGNNTPSVPYQKNNTTALLYYNKSIVSVKKRILQSNASSDDGLIIALLSFLCYNVKIQNFEQWNIHIIGLERLIALRGGIDTLDNAYTRLLIIWQDLCGAAAIDVSPRFPLSPDLNFYAAYKGLGTRSSIFRSNLEGLRITSPSFEETINVLEFMAGVSIFIKDGAADETFWDNDIQTTQLIINLVHKALSLPRMEPESVYLCALLTPDLIIREVLRGSMIIFLALLKVRSGFSMAPLELVKHISSLRFFLSLPTINWSFIPELKLWVLFICSFGPSSGDREWSVSHIKGEMLKHRLSNSADVLKVVNEIIWIENLVPKEYLRCICAAIDADI